MSGEAVAYVHQHVTLDFDAAEAAVAYVYQNVGYTARSRLGAVYGLSGPHLTPIAYVYQNVTEV